MFRLPLDLSSYKGFYCQCWADPKTGDGLVVFTNRDLCWKFANELRDAWLAEK
ncbi:hypothetical protein [Armatimonas sp.]|uniref:hypothetical protein n=1 Tax=Armatimonas sp. TaxID=1872638 RepID=UPI0037523AF4